MFLRFEQNYFLFYLTRMEGNSRKRKVEEIEDPISCETTSDSEDDVDDYLERINERISYIRHYLKTFLWGHGKFFKLIKNRTAARAERNFSRRASQALPYGVQMVGATYVECILSSYIESYEDTNA